MSCVLEKNFCKAILNVLKPILFFSTMNQSTKAQIGAYKTQNEPECNRPCICSEFPGRPPDPSLSVILSVHG